MNRPRPFFSARDFWRLGAVALLAGGAAIVVVAAAMFLPNIAKTRAEDIPGALGILGSTFLFGGLATVAAHLVASPVMLLIYVALRRRGDAMATAGPLVSAGWTGAAWFATLAFLGVDELAFVAPSGLIFLTVAVSLLIAFFGARVFFRGM